MTLSPSSSLSDICQMPDVSCQDCALEPLRQWQIALRAGERRRKRAGDTGELPKCACWIGIKAHLCFRLPQLLRSAVIPAWAVPVAWRSSTGFFEMSVQPTSGALDGGRATARL